MWHCQWHYALNERLWHRVGHGSALLLEDTLLHRAGGTACIESSDLFRVCFTPVMVPGLAAKRIKGVSETPQNLPAQLAASLRILDR